MMSRIGIKMRSLENFFHRRRVKDVSQWLKNMNIYSYEALVVWCENNDIFVPEEGKYGLSSTSTEEAAKTKSSKTKQQEIDDSNATWHIPAAERPRKPTTKSSSSQKKVTRTKKRTSKK